MSPPVVSRTVGAASRACGRMTGRRGVSRPFALRSSLWWCAPLFVLAVATRGAAPGEVSMGTTILAVRHRGGVVVGADSRTSVSGYVSNRFAAKLTFVLEDRSTCCVCRSGSAADTQHLAEIVREELAARDGLGPPGGRNTVTHAAHVFRHALVYDEPDLSCSLVCAGYDHVLQRGVVYAIAPGGTLWEEPRWAAGGSGSSYILGHLDHHLQEQQHGDDDRQHLMEEEEAVTFVREALELAMSRDGSSGGFVRLYVIDKNGKRDVGKTMRRTSFVTTSRAEAAVSLQNFAPPIASP